MLDLLPENTLLKLTDVAKELNVKPDWLLLYIWSESNSVIKMRVESCTKTSTRFRLYDNKDLPTTADEWNSRSYITINRETIEQIIDNGRYSTSCHEVEILGEEEIVTVRYLPGMKSARTENMEIGATIETLYLSAYHAKVTRERKKQTEQVNLPATHVSLFPDDGRPKLSGIIAICKFYVEDIKKKEFPEGKKAKDCNEWRTIRPKLENREFLKKEGNTPWTTPLAMENIYFPKQ